MARDETAPNRVTLKRVYEPRVPEDGTRVLVERLWPRGIRKEDPRIDRWLKELAPSPALRTWYGHEPAKWPEFQRRYRRELDMPAPLATDDLRMLARLLREGTVTLVYAARDEQRNSARLLAAWLAER